MLKSITVFITGTFFCLQLSYGSEDDKLPAKDEKSKQQHHDHADSLHNQMQPAAFSLEYTKLSLSQQLDSLQKDIPLSFNSHVEAFIKAYTGQRYRNHLAKMLGLAQYYFPIYDKVFEETQVPNEIKYLSIVESALNPHAVSRVGATGPWQFMFTTAKAFNLNIDNYIDERKDPYAASYAAAAYLKDAYQDFGDWLLAIASYNCGKGNVARAIQRLGDKEEPNFWNIRRFLPAETRDYVPAFIALTYVMNNCQAYDILPTPCEMELTTDVIFIDKFVPLSGVAEALELDVNTLSLLNPAFKKHLINGTPEAPKRLVVPAVDKANYARLYAVLNTPSTESPKIIAASNADQRIVYHKVRQGESLGSIAKKYNVEVQDLKAWNNLNRTVIVPGQRLQVSNMEGSAVKTASFTKKQRNYTTYKVKPGDSLSAIAQKYKGATVKNIKAMNNLKGNTLKPGMSLQIKQF